MATTDETWAELVDAVTGVASAPPAEPGANVFAAKVPWTRIQRLRAALDAVEIEWRQPS